MNKRLFSILFTLFLVGILSVSCSNKDKTGSDSSSNSNGKVDTIYAGDWYEDELLAMKIDSNGDISVPSLEIGDTTDKKVEGSGNSYTITYTKGTDKIVLQITFTDNNNATVIINNEVDNPRYLVVRR